MNRFFVLLGVVLASTIAHAVDATKNVTEIARSGRWMVIEFAATKQLIYRISSSATNSVDNNIVFDFVPSKKCEPTSAVMIAQQRAYSPALDDGIVLLRKH